MADAFNIPFSPFNPNESVGPLTFASTTTINGNRNLQTHTVTHDICLIYLHATYTGNYPWTSDYYVTALKNESLNSISGGLSNFSLQKIDDTIQVQFTYTFTNNNGIVTIYEFDFA